MGLKLHVARRKILASIFATIIGLQSIAYGPLSAETAKVYWTTMTYPHFIKRADLNGSDAEVLVTKGPKALDLALDLVAGKVYWTEDHGTIRRADLDGSNAEDLVESVGAEQVALDSERGKMYWTSVEKIQRANLEGSDAETLISLDEQYGPVETLALDVANAKMYWHWLNLDSGYFGYSGIQRANMDGSNVENLVAIIEADRSLLVTAFSLDVRKGNLYWVELDPESAAIYRAELDGSNVEEVYKLAGRGSISSLIIDTTGDKIYWREYIRLHGPPKEFLMRADLDGSNRENVEFLPPWDYAFDPAAGKLYWTNGYEIRRADYDGSDFDGLNTENIEEFIRISFPFLPRGITVDGAGKKMYWTDGGKQAIQRADLDGSNTEVLITGLLDPMGIDLDEAVSKMYWVEYDRIRRADLDGEDEEDLIEGLSHPFGIEIDEVMGKMYWTDQTGIHRADLEGSNAEVLVASWSSDARRIAVDRVQGKIYWTDYGRIQLADLDGSNVETFLPEAEAQGRPANGPSKTYAVGIALDAVRRRLHWTAVEFFPEWGSYYGFYHGISEIKQAGLDDYGSDIFSFSIREPAGDLALYLPQPVPTLASTPGASTGVPATSRLGPNYPNPFNADTRIPYRLGEPGPVRLEIYNVLGQLVRILVDQVQAAGFYEVYWDARDQEGATVSAGVYLARLHFRGGAETRRQLYLK